MTHSRLCPSCKRKTDASVCPHDGYRTVEAARFERPEQRLVGRVFNDRYRVEALIGLGGMGAVYRATQVTVGREVALKVLRPEYATSLEVVRRFQTEARASSRLDHPNTIRIYDFGQSTDGHLYLVCELLEGEPLSALMARERPLGPGRVASIACQILKGLSEAHEKSIIHRDLKPENIFLKRVHGEQDFVKVLDFGIAKVMDGNTSATTTGTVVGTPLYMSPEQATAEDVTHASDLYGLGAVMYEMLTGDPPFTGDSAMSVMLKHVQARPAPIEFDHEHPALADLRRAVLDCLAKDPKRRPPSADALRERLEQFIWDYEGEVPPRSERSEPHIKVPPPDTSGPALDPLLLDSSFDTRMAEEVAELAGVGRWKRPVLIALAGLVLVVFWVFAVPAAVRFVRGEAPKPTVSRAATPVTTEPVADAQARAAAEAASSERRALEVKTTRRGLKPVRKRRSSRKKRPAPTALPELRVEKK